mgnify:CR=1 FL=1
MLDQTGKIWTLYVSGPNAGKSSLLDRMTAAEAIAGGRLDTRLEDVDDKDLEALVSSFNDMAAALQPEGERTGDDGNEHQEDDE